MCNWSHYMKWYSGCISILQDIFQRSMLLNVLVIALNTSLYVDISKRWIKPSDLQLIYGIFQQYVATFHILAQSTAEIVTLPSFGNRIISKEISPEPSDITIIYLWNKQRNLWNKFSSVDALKNNILAD